MLFEQVEDAGRLGDDADVIVAQAGALGGELDGVLQPADLVDQADIQGLSAGSPRMSRTARSTYASTGTW